MYLGTSLSAPEVNLLHRDEVMDPVLSSKPNFLSGSVIRQVGRFHNEPKASMVSLISLKSRFLDLNRRIRSLETINNSLRAENAAVRAEIAVLGDDLQASRASLCAEVEQRRKDALCMEQADEKIHRLVTQVCQYADFINILAEIGTNKPTYHGALSSMSIAETEGALVAGIMEAKKYKELPRSQLVSSRSPDQYVSTLNFTRRTRQDPRKCERVCEHWKTRSKPAPSDADFLATSTLTLMDGDCLCNTDVPTKAKSTVLDDILRHLKNYSLSECSASPVSSVTFKSMAEWAENAAREEFFEQSPSHIHEEINRESNLNPFPPIAGAQPLNGLPGALNSPLSLLDHPSPLSGYEYPQMNDHATNREPASVQIQKSTPKEPNPPEFVMARFHKRHSLQSIDHNVGASQHGNENKADHIEPNPFKARARDLGKRRGVILTENMNIGSSNISAATSSTLIDTATPDLSRFTSQISDLVASLSNSDLGSLEMNGESDSDADTTEQRLDSSQITFGQPRCLNALSRVCKDIMGEHEVGSPESRPHGRFKSLISATFGSGHAIDSTNTSSSISTSSSIASSSFSKSINSLSRSPPFGLINQQSTVNGSTTVENRANSAPLSRGISTGKPKTQQSTSIEKIALSKIPCPTKSIFAPESKVNENGGETVVRSPVVPLSLSGFSASTTIQNGSREINRPTSKQLVPNAPHIFPGRGPKLWIGQAIFNRFSNSQSKIQSSTSTLLNKPSKSRLLSNGHAIFTIKPRSNTINTLLRPSTRPYSKQGLEPPAPSTKPRSNTVNTYPPSTRSPLSQHVTNASHELQAAAAHAMMPSPKFSSPKPVTSPKITRSVGKRIAPLRIAKNVVSDRPGLLPGGNGRVPPTAAFMSPNLAAMNSGRKASSSVAVLIPTCPTSANGIISPSQCRSLLRNRLSGTDSSVVR